MIQILGVVSWVYLPLVPCLFPVDRRTCDFFLAVLSVPSLFCLYLIFLISLSCVSCAVGWFVAIFISIFFFELLCRELQEGELPHCFPELASSHLSVVVTSPKVPGEWSGGCTATGFWEGTILPMLYKQLTPSKRKYLLIENLPQALFSVVFLLVEGGSFFVSVLNLLVPGVQILLTCLLLSSWCCSLLHQRWAKS